MTPASRLCAYAIAACVATGVQAQSTSRVGESEKPLRLEVSAGYDRSGSNNSFYGDPGTVLAGAVAIRWAPEAWGGVRLTLHGIQRRSRSVTQYSPTDADSVETEDRVFGVSVSTDASFRIWRDLTIAPSVGAGYSPYAHGQQTITSTRSVLSNQPRPNNSYSRSANGWLWMAGVALRYRHFVIEKSAIALVGAQDAVTHGDGYFPLSIGFRF